MSCAEDRLPKNSSLIGAELWEATSRFSWDRPGSAYCTGRGEILEPVDALPTTYKHLFVIKPYRGLSTPLVFKTLGCLRIFVH